MPSGDIGSTGRAKVNASDLAEARDTVDLLEAPAALLDTDSARVLAVNGALAALLGFSREESIGRAWNSLCPGMPIAPSEHGPVGRERRARIVDSGGRRLDLQYVAVPFRRARVHGTLVKILDYEVVMGDVPRGHRIYTISIDPADWGELTDLTFLDGAPEASRTGKCYSVLYGAHEPCEGCPALRRLVRGESHTSLLPLAERAGMALVTARGLAGDQRRVVHLALGRQDLDLLTEAKLAHAANKADLSGREKEVFSLLVRGRSPTDVANALGIAVSTAKYHTSHILRKLGVDSRHDLIRLLL